MCSAGALGFVVSVVVTGERCAGSSSTARKSWSAGSTSAAGRNSSLCARSVATGRRSGAACSGATTMDSGLDGDDGATGSSSSTSFDATNSNSAFDDANEGDDARVVEPSASPTNADPGRAVAGEGKVGESGGEGRCVSSDLLTSFVKAGEVGNDDVGVGLSGGWARAQAAGEGGTETSTSA
ncbi:hypothetical protein C8R46DRAFT_1074682 [Mycena filopes]|nr:hypothetical protein C8R46DRAFT_1074682 [Mycena filopes]